MELIAFIFWLAVAFIMLWPYAIIAERVGITKWFVVTQFIPVVNFIALWYLALTAWKIDTSDRREYQINGKKR